MLREHAVLCHFLVTVAAVVDVVTRIGLAIQHFDSFALVLVADIGAIDFMLFVQHMRVDYRSAGMSNLAITNMRQRFLGGGAQRLFGSILNGLIVAG